jgi:hypothetical protein
MGRTRGRHFSGRFCRGAKSHVENIRLGGIAMKTDPNESDSCCSLPASDVPNKSARRRFPWGVVCAISLFVYSVIPLMIGISGLILVPGILLGGVTIGEHTTLLKILGWVLFHLLITAHGCAIIIAAISFYRLQWRRGIYAFAVGVIVPAIIYAASYVVFITFRVAN